MKTEPIPGPPGLPLVGNIADIDATNPIQSMCNLTLKYGKPLSQDPPHTIPVCISNIRHDYDQHVITLIESMTSQVVPGDTRR